MRLALPFVLACAVALVPTSAHAADELGLSYDGTHWSADLTSPLFSPSFIWIPGDHETRSFWARNQSSDAARLDIELVGDSVQDLMEAGQLSLTASTSSGGQGAAAAVGTHQLVTSRAIGAGQTEKVDVTVDFDYQASLNQSQEQDYQFHLLVRLTQDTSQQGGGKHHHGGGKGGHGGHGRDRNGILPGTGGPSLWILGAGILGVSSGWLTVLASRRREVSHVQSSRLQG